MLQSVDAPMSSQLLFRMTSRFRFTGLVHGRGSRSCSLETNLASRAADKELDMSHVLDACVSPPRHVRDQFRLQRGNPSTFIHLINGVLRHPEAFNAVQQGRPCRLAHVKAQRGAVTESKLLRVRVDGGYLAR